MCKNNRLGSFIVFGLLLSLSLGCGGDSYDSLSNATMSQLEAYVNELESVTDLESAMKAKSEIEKIGAKLKELKERAQKLPEPSLEVMQQLNEEMKDRQVALTNRLVAARGNLMAKPELMVELSSAMDAIDQFNE